MSLESQNEAAKLHLGASLRMGDWLRNDSERATAGRPEKNSCGLQPLTLADLGIEKTDAFRLQRFYDWEQTLSTVVWIGNG